MWRFHDNSVVFDESCLGNIFSFPVLDPDWSLFPGTVFSCSSPNLPYVGYNDWISHFPREDELSLVRDALLYSQEEHKRVHIRGISTYEAVEEIRSYYRDQEYEDALAKNYTIPSTELVTVSVTLGQVIWCEKDKGFLKNKDIQDKPYYAVVPPLRSPHDLRALQQALRMGIIMGLEIPSGFTGFVDELLQKQILSLYQIGLVTSSHWSKHQFSGETEVAEIVISDLVSDAFSD